MSNNKKRLVPIRRFNEFKNSDAWEHRKLGEMGEVITGNTPKTDDKSNWDETPNGYVWITPTDIKSLETDNSERHLSDKGWMKSRKLPKNSVLITSIASIGKNTINTVPAAFNQQINAIIPKENDPYFILSLMEKESRRFESMAGETATKIINKKTFENYEIVVPNLVEQKTIGRILHNFDNLIALHQRKIDKLKRVKSAYLTEMFPAEGEREPKRRFPGFTGAWEQHKLGEWGTFYYGHSCPKWSVTADATTPCIRYGELYTKFGTKIDKVFSYTNIPTDKLRFSKGTEVLIPRVGEDPMDYNHCTWLSMRDVAIGEMISVFNTEQNPLFTATMFNATLQKEFAMRVEGGSVTNLYYEKLKNIEVSFPEIDEQMKIAKFFEETDHLITLQQHKLNKLRRLKAAYLNEMFV